MFQSSDIIQRKEYTIMDEKVKYWIDLAEYDLETAKAMFVVVKLFCNTCG